MFVESGYAFVDKTKSSTTPDSNTPHTNDAGDGYGDSEIP